jgi:uncharacterized protein YndB with AHSA1/START domain
MTAQRSFKRLVRLRMAKTGESYTAARAALLAAREPDSSPTADAHPRLVTSDEAIRQRTGRGWEDWFDLLDAAGMTERSHRDIARWVAELQGVVPLAWTAQAVTVSYERARGGREVGQRTDGFAISVSRTVEVPVDRLFLAFTDETERTRWLGGAELRERTARRPRSARFDWGEDGTRVNATFTPKAEARSAVSVEHTRLADGDAADRLKQVWRERLAALKATLEEGDVRA